MGGRPIPPGGRDGRPWPAGAPTTSSRPGRLQPPMNRNRRSSHPTLSTGAPPSPQVRRGVLVVSELVDVVGGEQRYLRRKVERHIDTCVSAGRGGRFCVCVCVGGSFQCGFGGVGVGTCFVRSRGQRECRGTSQRAPLFPSSLHKHAPLTPLPSTPPPPKQRSNRRRTLWYTALEVAALAGLGALNVWAVSGFFKGAGRYGGKICV